MITALYADGGIIGGKNPSIHGGTFAWCLIDQKGERVKTGSGSITPERARLPHIENNFTEYLAIVSGLEKLPYGWSGQVCSDNQNALMRLFAGWKVNGIPPWLLEQAYEALKRLDVPNITYTLLCGHPTRSELAAGYGKRGYPVSIHNVWCDDECQRQAKEFMKGHKVTV